MTQKEFKEYVLREAKAIMKRETLQDKQDSSIKAKKEHRSSKSKLHEEVKQEDKITPESIAELAKQMKLINESLLVNNPLIAEENIVDEVIKENAKRKLKTPVGREYDIEMKETLHETMIHYNDQKLLNHKKENSTETWNRLTNYKRFSDV